MLSSHQRNKGWATKGQRGRRESARKLCITYKNTLTEWYDWHSQIKFNFHEIALKCWRALLHMSKYTMPSNMDIKWGACDICKCIRICLHSHSLHICFGCAIVARYIDIHILLDFIICYLYTIQSAWLLQVFFIFTLCTWMPCLMLWLWFVAIENGCVV